MDDDWTVSPITQANRDKAWRQLGTSGSGNHFVEFGRLTVLADGGGTAAGRVPGAAVPQRQPRHRAPRSADHYSRLARNLQPELPKELAQPGVARPGQPAGAGVLGGDEADGATTRRPTTPASTARGARPRRAGDARRGEPPQLRLAKRTHWSASAVIVHRKGATPAGAGVLGIIPGSMATPGFIVRGRGNARLARLGRARRGPRHEPHEGEGEFTWPEVARCCASAA